MDLSEFYSEWKAWFDQPEAYKKEHLRQPGKGGYYPPQSETPGFTGVKDEKEYFHWRLNHAEYCQEGREENTCNLFMQSYSVAASHFMRMGAPELVFHPEHSVLRIIRYFGDDDGIYGEPHKDFNLATVAWPGTKPGLQLFEGGRWVQPVDEVYTFHYGEMFEIHTSGVIKATQHRVQNKTPGERLSAVFFYLPPMGFELKPGYTAEQYLKETLTKAGTYSIGAKDD